MRWKLTPHVAPSFTGKDTIFQAADGKAGALGGTRRISTETRLAGHGSLGRLLCTTSIGAILAVSVAPATGFAQTFTGNQTTSGPFAGEM